jgi:dCMP deaminase
MDKFTKKYMKLAKTLAEDNDTCGARKIAAIIVRDRKVLGVGYNGPPAGVPHNHTLDSLKNYLRPQLTDKDLDILRIRFKTIEDSYKTIERDKLCPRRVLGYSNGEKACLCSCQHAERNAITNAACDLTGAVMYCWCGVPCIQCSGAIVNAGISMLVCLGGFIDYEPSARYILLEANVSLVELNKEAFT